MKELIPVSQNLAALWAAGLQALNYIDRGERASESWKSDQVVMIAQTKTPRADALVAVGPAVQTLVGGACGCPPAIARRLRNLNRAGLRL